MFWFTFNLAVHFRPNNGTDVRNFIRLNSHVTSESVAVATHFSSSLLVLGGLNLHSAICFAKEAGVAIFGFADFTNVWLGFSVFPLENCGFSVLGSSTVCGFSRI